MDRNIAKRKEIIATYDTTITLAIPFSYFNDKCTTMATITLDMMKYVIAYICTQVTNKLQV